MIVARNSIVIQHITLKIYINFDDGDNFQFQELETFIRKISLLYMHILVQSQRYKHPFFNCLHTNGCSEYIDIDIDIYLFQTDRVRPFSVSVSQILNLDLFIQI